MIIVRHLGQLSQDSENLSKGQPAWGKSHLDHLGHWTIKRISSGGMRHNATDNDNSLLSENVGIVEKILRIIKDPLG